MHTKSVRTMLIETWDFSEETQYFFNCF